MPDNVHHVAEADFLHCHFPRQVLEKLHLVKLVTGLGEDEAAPGHDVLGGEADHGHRLLVMEGGHPGLGGPGLWTIVGQQLGAQTEAGDHYQGQAPDQGQPPPPTGQGCEHHQDAAIVVIVLLCHHYWL